MGIPHSFKLKKDLNGSFCFHFRVPIDMKPASKELVKPLHMYGVFSKMISELKNTEGTHVRYMQKPNPAFNSTIFSIILFVE